MTKTKRKTTTTKSSKNKKATQVLSRIQRPELIIGLVAPIGTDLKMVSKVLIEQLSSLVGYRAVDIHVTDLMDPMKTQLQLKEDPLEDRYVSYMNAGNTIRKKTGRPDALAILSIAAIRQHRQQQTSDPNKAAENTAYILHQFKRPEEIERMRAIYGQNFIQVSAYSSKQSRIASLTKKISRCKHGEHADEYHKSAAFRLIYRDESEEEEKAYGQRVRDTFPLADVILDAEDKKSLERTTTRFIRAYFNDPFVTPSRDEYAAYISKAASLRSADLSRQVGAVLTNKVGDLIAIGCNEVPKPGGGVYWEDDSFDARDHIIGQDSSVRIRQAMLEDAFRRMKEKGYLNREQSKKSIEELVSDALTVGEKPFMKDSLIMDVIEFGRSVHAEMAAITDAAKRGVSLKSTTLYCTTFPCHICARHIVSSGIERVVYIEPYSKSLVRELYPDSISVEDDREKKGPKVAFETFVGIAPEKFRDIFTLRDKRKDENGYAANWDGLKSQPICETYDAYYTVREELILASLSILLKKAKLLARSRKLPS